MKKHLRPLVRAVCVSFLRLRSRRYAPAVAGRCVIIAPHQDDEVLGCAGLIHAHRQAGRPVDVVYVTDGAASHRGHPTLAPADVAPMRRSEATAALRPLGVAPESLHFLDAPDGTLAHLSPTEAGAISHRLAHTLASLAPTELFLPCRDDGSSEHTAAYQLTRRALVLAGLAPRLLEYPVWARWSPLRLLRPGWSSRRVLRLSSPRFRTLKREALAAYASQTRPTPPWTRPVLPEGFAACFESSEEFFFER